MKGLLHPCAVLCILCAEAAVGALSPSVSFDVEAGNPIHVAWRDDAEGPALALVNDSGFPNRLCGRFLLVDLAGHSLEVPFDADFAANATNRFPVPWPLPAKGYWMAIAEVKGRDGFFAQQCATFAVLDRRMATRRLPPGKFRMGINYHYHRMSRADRDATLDALVACGAKLVRFEFARWKDVQPREGMAPDWSRIDQGLADFEARGIDIDAICWLNPQWAARPDRRESRNWFDWAFTMPERQDLLHDFMRDLAARYGTRIAWYELGNEWELGGFRGDADEAVAIQKLCFSALKEGNRKVKVIPNGWANWDSESVQVPKEKKGFPEKVMREAHGFYDAHPVHHHGGFAEFRKAILTRFLPRRRAMGIDDVPWYSNEAAHTGVHGNELNVANLVWQKILFAWAYGSCDYIWYNLRATGEDENDPEAGFGLLTRDLHPRPSYCSFAALTELLSGFDFERVVESDGKREIYLFSGQRGGERQRVLAGWDSSAVTGRCVRVLTDARRAWAVDFMGNRAPAGSGALSAADARNGVHAVLWEVSRRPSALLLEGAAIAETPSEGNAAGVPAESRIVVGRGPFSSRRPDFVADTAMDVHGFYDGNPLTVNRTWQGPDDASFKAWFAIRDGALAIRVDATDDVHEQHAAKPRLMSEGDCLRVTLEVGGGRCWELGFRRTDAGESESVVWEGPRRELPGMRFNSRREGAETVYGVLIPLAALASGGADVTPESISIALKLDDADVEGRDLWIGMEDAVQLAFPAIEGDIGGDGK